MRRLISASLLILLSIAPAWAQQPLQGKIERQDASESHNPPRDPLRLFPTAPPKLPGTDDLQKLLPPRVPPTMTKVPTFEELHRLDREQPRRAPTVQPKVPTAEDLRPLQGGESGPSPSGVWSMTILPSSGMIVNSLDITWGVEYANPKLRHDWNVWLSRIMLVLYQDCSRFRCPNVSDHECTINVRRDGTVATNIVPGGDVPSTLFANAAMRLQGQQVLDFPADSHQDKISFKLNLHYGKPLPNSSIFKDAFGQPDARYPIEKTNW
jgi:hypothetical protein